MVTSVTSLQGAAPLRILCAKILQVFLVECLILYIIFTVLYMMLMLYCIKYKYSCGHFDGNLGDVIAGCSPTSDTVCQNINVNCFHIFQQFKDDIKKKLKENKIKFYSVTTEAY